MEKSNNVLLSEMGKILLWASNLFELGNTLSKKSFANNPNAPLIAPAIVNNTNTTGTTALLLIESYATKLNNVIPAKNMNRVIGYE